MHHALATMHDATPNSLCWQFAINFRRQVNITSVRSPVTVSLEMGGHTYTRTRVTSNSQKQRCALHSAVKCRSDRMVTGDLTGVGLQPVSTFIPTGTEFSDEQSCSLLLVGGLFVRSLRAATPGNMRDRQLTLVNVGFAWPMPHGALMSAKQIQR